MTMTKSTHPLPQAKAARIDAEISERAHRISAGNSKPGDVSDLKTLVGKRAALMLPRSVQKRLSEHTGSYRVRARA